MINPRLSTASHVPLHSAAVRWQNSHYPYCNRDLVLNHVSNWWNTCEWEIIGVTSKSEFVRPPVPLSFKVCVTLCISKLSPICHRIKVRLKWPNWTAGEIECVAAAWGWTDRGIFHSGAVASRLCWSKQSEPPPTIRNDQYMCGSSRFSRLTHQLCSFVILTLSHEQIWLNF